MIVQRAQSAVVQHNQEWALVRRLYKLRTCVVVMPSAHVQTSCLMNSMKINLALPVLVCHFSKPFLACAYLAYILVGSVAFTHVFVMSRCGVGVSDRLKHAEVKKGGKAMGPVVTRQHEGHLDYCVRFQTHRWVRPSRRVGLLHDLR